MEEWSAIDRPAAALEPTSTEDSSRVSAAAWRPSVLPPAPPASSPAARRVLQRNARRDTAPELELRRRLHALGLRFLVDASPRGTSRRRRADVVLRGSRIAVLVHGCFWHRCPEHFHAPKANADWWRLKFASVVARDEDTERQLGAAGWLPVVVWQHEDMAEAARRIRDLDTSRRASRAAVAGRPGVC
jgi:DNA mismatch endonuclease (patch repair protein)